jgi:cyclophilin family peptidyl-prolyl cis-trans isomerase
VVVGAEGAAAGNAIEDSTVQRSGQGVLLAAGARQSSVQRSVFLDNTNGAVVLAAPVAGLIPIGNRVSQNRYLGRGGLIDLGGGSAPVVGPPCSRDSLRANDGLQPPVIASASTGLAGASLVAGKVCPGQSVEVYRMSRGESNRMELIGTDPGGECGEFAVRSRELKPGDQVVALAIDPSGNTSVPGPEFTVTATREPEATIEVGGGEIVVRLLPQLAPRHVENFAVIAREHGYDGTIFHRIVGGELVQGGDPFTRDPNDTARYGTGGLGDLVAEFSDRCVRRGLLVAARCPTDCDSAGAQFFLTAKDQPEMTGHFTVFGDVLSGMDVVDRLAASRVDAGRPRDRLEMQVSVTPPEARGKDKTKTKGTGK